MCPDASTDVKQWNPRIGTIDIQCTYCGHAVTVDFCDDSEKPSYIRPARHVAEKRAASEFMRRGFRGFVKSAKCLRCKTCGTKPRY